MRTVPLFLPALAWLAMAVTCSVPSLAEERLHRVDVSKKPWSAVGRIHNSTGGHCTGVLIAPSLAVTAAHCLYSARAGAMVSARSVHFLLGYERGSYEHHTVARAYQVADGFNPSRPVETPSSDWALIELEDPAPKRFPPIAVSEAIPSESSFVSAGYGIQRRYWLTSTDSCVVRQETDSGMIIGSCPTVSGFSGGPLINDDSELIGIQTGNGRQNGKAVLLGVSSKNFADHMK